MPANLTPDPSLTEAEWAWCAGLFEGEGCIMFRKDSLCVVAKIAMTDRDVLERLDELWPSPNGVRLDRDDPRQPHYLRVWRWQISSARRVEGFLVGIYPWLGERRRAKTDEALGRLARARGRPELHDTCRNGHPLAGENLYIAPRDGARVCKRCQADAQLRQKGRSCLPA